jgi:hypothetical protein
MTTQHQIIAICVIAFISVPLGTFIAIKTINKLSRPQVNTLTRTRGDIELDYIDPAQPGRVYQPLDMVNPNYESYNWSDRVPSYFSGNPPSYQTIDRSYIHSSLENNLDYILWIILFCVFVLIIINLLVLISNKSDINKSKNLIIINLLVLFLGTVYIQFGLLVLFQIISLSIIMILSNSLLGINPYDKWLHIIKIMSILLIIFILYYNSRDILISSAFMTPLSISRISYINDLDIPAFADFESEKIEIFSKFTIKETTDFLNKLEDNESYIVDIRFIPNIVLWDLDAPQLSLANPVLINRNSSPVTINKFIMERLDYMVDYYYLDDAIISKESNCAVSLSYCKLKSL